MKPARQSRYRHLLIVATMCALLTQQTAYAQSPGAQMPTPVPIVADDPFAPTPAAVLEPGLPQSPATAAPSAPGKLDLEGMRRSVRAMPIDDDRPSGPMGTVFAAAPAPGLQRFRNQFDDGKRPWCLTAFQGAGVLALIAMPLAALLDKKDHGCKW